MATATKRAKSRTRNPTNIERSYIEGYRQGVKDSVNYKDSFGSYASASCGYYKGLKDAKTVRKVNKRTKYDNR